MADCGAVFNLLNKRNRWCTVTVGYHYTLWFHSEHTPVTLRSMGSWGLFEEDLSFRSVPPVGGHTRYTARGEGCYEPLV